MKPLLVALTAICVAGAAMAEPVALKFAIPIE